MAKTGKISCPNCGSSNMTFNAWLGQIWTCQHCGYRGPVDLVEGGEPSEKDKKLLQEIEEEVKNEKPSANKDEGYRKISIVAIVIFILFLMVPALLALVGGGILLLLYYIWKGR